MDRCDTSRSSVHNLGAAIMIHRKLLLATLAGTALASAPAWGQSAEVGKVGTFRFGTAAAPSPDFAQEEGADLKLLDGSADSVRIEGSDNGWRYSNAPSGLVYTAPNGDLPPGFALRPDGTIEIPPFESLGSTHEFVVRTTNAAGIHSDRTFRFTTKLPASAPAEDRIPSAATSSVSGPFPSVQLYDGASNTRPVAAGETIVLTFAEPVKAGDALVLLASGAPSSHVVVSYTTPGGRTFSSTRTALEAGVPARPAIGPDSETPAVSRQFSFRFEEATSLADIRLAGAPVASKPSMPLASGTTVADAATAAGRSYELAPGAAQIKSIVLASGELPPGVSIQGTKLAFAPSATAAGGPWDFSVQGVDDRGVPSDPVSLRIAATASATAAVTLPASSFAWYPSYSSTDASKIPPYALYLQDGSDATGFSGSPGDSISLDYGRTVSFDRFLLRTKQAFDVSIRLSDGTLRTIHSEPAGDGSTKLVELGREHVAQQVVLTARGAPPNATEFRLGNSAPTAYPSLNGALRRHFVDASTPIVPASDIVNTSPWSTKTTLSIVDDGRLQLSTDGTKLSIGAAPATDTPIRIRLTGSDGMATDVNLVLAPIRTPQGSETVPYDTTTSGNPVAPVPYQSEAYVYYDDDPSSYVPISANQYLIFDYSKTIEFDRVLVRSKGGRNMVLQHSVGGKLVEIAKIPAGTDGVVVLDKPYQTSYVRLTGTDGSGTSNVSEFRPGAGPAMKRPVLTAGPVRTREADGTILRASDFDDASPYSNKVSLTHNAGSGVTVTAQGDSFKVASPVNADAQILVRATSEDGTTTDSQIQVVATVPGLDPTKIAPSSMQSWSSSDIVKGDPSAPSTYHQPDFLSIMDADAATYVDVNRENGYAAPYYPTPATFDRVLVQSSGTRRLKLQVYVPGGWIDVAELDGNTDRTIVLDRAYTSIAARLVGMAGTGSTKVATMRLGAGPAMAKPTLIGSMFRTREADGTLLRYTDFDDASPYSAKVNVGVSSSYMNFTATGDALKTSSIPNIDTLFKALVKSQDGSTLVQNIVVAGTPGSDPRTTAISSHYSSSGGPVGVASGQQPQSVYSDGRPGSYQTFSTSGQFVNLEYATPISYDAVYVEATGTRNLEIRAAASLENVVLATIPAGYKGEIDLGRVWTSKSLYVFATDGSGSSNLAEFQPRRR